MSTRTEEEKQKEVQERKQARKLKRGELGGLGQGLMGGGMTKMKYKKGGKVKKHNIDGVARKGKTRGKVV